MAAPSIGCVRERKKVNSQGQDPQQQHASCCGSLCESLQAHSRNGCFLWPCLTVFSFYYLWGHKNSVSAPAPCVTSPSHYSNRSIERIWARYNAGAVMRFSGCFCPRKCVQGIALIFCGRSRDSPTWPDTSCATALAKMRVPQHVNPIPCCGEKRMRATL